MKNYVLGNWLRGYFEGEFESLEEAWSYLSNRFLLSFPSNGGRMVSMWINEKNKYGIDQLIICKYDYTEINSLVEEEVRNKCKRSLHSNL